MCCGYNESVSELQDNSLTLDPDIIDILWWIALDFLGIFEDGLF